MGGAKSLKDHKLDLEIDGALKERSGGDSVENFRKNQLAVHEPNADGSACSTWNMQGICLSSGSMFHVEH